MAIFTPETDVEIRDGRRVRGLESARKRAEQREWVVEMRADLASAGFRHKYGAVEQRMGLRAGRLSELFSCDTVWDLEPRVFRAVVLQAIKEAS